VKVVAFSGSARKGGNTALLLERVLTRLETEGIETELVELAGKKAQGCTACRKCWETKDRRCHGRNDVINECIEKMDAADGILIGSPVYFADVSSETKALIDRAGYVARANGNMFARKAGAAVVAVRRAGGMHAFDTINHFFLIGRMIVPGASYWNIGVGGPVGSVEDDTEGMDTMDALAENMAWLLKHTAEHRD
jgi:multimeric flavodoxin WrbA